MIRAFDRLTSGRHDMRRLIATVLGSSMLVSACGGGGGGNSPPPVGTPLTITVANQDGVARATAAAAASLLGAGSGATASDRPSAAVAGMGAAQRASLRDAARRAAALVGGADGPARKRLAAAGAVRPLAIDPLTEPCAVSGSLTLSFVDADNNGLASVGDTMTLTYSQCRDTATDLAQGSISITFSRIELVNGLVRFAGSMSIPQFTLTEGTRGASLAGGLTMTYTEDSLTQSRLTLVVGGNGLTAGVTGAGLNETIGYESEFSLSETDTLNATTGELVFATATVGGGFSASSIGGRVVIEPVAPIVQYATEAYPRSGTLRVVGNASALRLTALDATTTRIELDANLDGTYEVSKDVAWVVLLPGG
jgi:hypothetical protein